MLYCSQGCRGYGNPIPMRMGLEWESDFPLWGFPYGDFPHIQIGCYNNSEKSSSEYAVTGVTALYQFVLVSIRVSYGNPYGNSHINLVGMG